MAQVIGRLADVSLFSWKGAVHGAKVAVEDRSANSMNGSLYVWKNYRIQQSTIEATVMCLEANEEALREKLEALQGTTQSLTRGNKGWLAKIISIEISPAIKTVTTIDNADTVLNIKFVCECEKGNG